MSVSIPSPSQVLFFFVVRRLHCTAYLSVASVALPRAVTDVGACKRGCSDTGDTDECEGAFLTRLGGSPAEIADRFSVGSLLLEVEAGRGGLKLALGPDLNM